MSLNGQPWHTKSMHIENEMDGNDPQKSIFDDLLAIMLKRAWLNYLDKGGVV